MERASGIEPPSKAWEASILPMNYARVIADSIILPLFVVFCKLVFERGDGGQDGDVGVAGEGLGAGGAGGDGEEVDSGIAGGLGVDVAVAGVEDVVFGHVEVVDGAQQACGLWFVALDVVAADDEVDELGHAIDVELLLDTAVRLVGDDADFGACGLDGAQCLDGAGEEGRAGRHVAVGLGAVGIDEVFGFGCVCRADDALDGLDHGQADGLLDALVGHIGVAELLQGDVEAFDDGGLGIDERVVEIEEVEAVIQGWRSFHEWLVTACVDAHDARMDIWRKSAILRL